MVELCLHSPILLHSVVFSFLIRIVGEWSPTGSSPRVCHQLAYCTCPRWFGGMMIARGNRNTRRNPSPMPLCPPQIPHDLIGREPRLPRWEASERLTAWAMHGLSVRSIVMYYPGIFLEERRTTRTHFIQDIRCPGRDSNRQLPIMGLNIFLSSFNKMSSGSGLVHWVKDCTVFMGYNRTLVTVRHLLSLSQFICSHYPANTCHFYPRFYSGASRSEV
jgi:hypothetical protein